MSQDWINGWGLWNLINNTSKQIDFLSEQKILKYLKTTLVYT